MKSIDIKTNLIFLRDIEEMLKANKLFSEHQEKATTGTKSSFFF